jgi:hypothetical protein
MGILVSVIGQCLDISRLRLSQEYFRYIFLAPDVLARHPANLAQGQPFRGQEDRMTDTAQGAARPGMPVIGSDGRHFGTVDHLDGEYLKLVPTEAAAGGRRRWLPIGLVASVAQDGVRLSRPAAEAEHAVLDEDEAQRRMTLDPDGRHEFGQPE